MEIKNSEFFKNIKKLPPPGTNEFNQLIDWEIEKCSGGVTIGGIFISGWLYWHLNHWWIRVDEQDKYGNDIRVEKLPDLRDNEWERAEYLEQCRINRKGYMEIGGRQGGKSEMEASYFGMNATLFENTQNVIVCGNDNDLSLLKDKVDFGLNSLWEGIKIPRLDKTWRTNQVRLGYKKSNGDDDIWSYIVIRNAKDGNNTEVAAGTTAKSFIMDEVGKYSFAAAFKAAEPAFKGKFGWRAIPILVGTGGSFDKGQDAEGFFLNPDANNFMPVVDPKSGRKTCLFLSGLYRQDCKELISLDKWLLQEKGIKVDSPELSQIQIYASNKIKAEALINQERNNAKSNPDKTLYLKQVMYYPLTIEECFLSSQVNIFNAERANRKIARLKESGKAYWEVELFMEDGQVKWRQSNKIPIAHYPHKMSDDKDAPIQIYEHPIKDAPYGLYVAGVDSYRDGSAQHSSSLGTVYIYKRMHAITGEEYQDMFVASYAARPDNKEVWEDQARLLCKYYNARVAVENNEMSFIEYMKNKGDAHMLVKMSEFTFIKEILPTTQVKTEYGINRTAPRLINYLHACLKKYSESSFYVEKNEEGSVTLELIGFDKILDPMLLEEMSKFNEEDNFDRIVAAEIAIAYANIMDPIIGKVTTQNDSRFQSYFDKSKKRTNLFLPAAPVFRRGKRKLFT